MTAVILVNYQSYVDTLECIESIAKSEDSNYKIFIVDNSSCKKAQGAFVHDLHESLLNQNVNDSCSVAVVDSSKFDLQNAAEFLTIVNTENNGFAAANNIVLQQIASSEKYKYAWLLNNDTKISSNTLKVYREEYNRLSQKKKLGILGCVLVYADEASIIQGVGGKYYKFLGTSAHILDGKKVDSLNPDTHYKIDYPIGASMFVSKEFVKDVGLLDESFFLYFEEMDWVIRSQKKGWESDYTSKIIIQHKAGKSIGGKNKMKKGSSEISDYYFYRNRLRFSLKYTPFHFPFVLAIVSISIMYRIAMGRSAFLRLFFKRKSFV